ncbi:hypothetical protein FJTKL_05971 [Diaporthe vaccinii]|uniref:Uncharacterized protein n=1 Tax=Diaporthe vaccinii TaxID=105482 RepID=A0ABR4DS79_9PEZI
MPPIRQSNVDRRRGRDECREKLAQHICSRLGVDIKPADVRLNPRETDFYVWRVVQGKEEVFSKIFAKNLSDHSTGIYKFLCREIGKSFEAVSPCGQVSTLDSIIPMSKEPSFSSIIDQLREENTRLCEQLREVMKKADMERQQRNTAEEGNRQSRSYQAQLEKDVQRYASTAAFFQGIVTKCAADMERVLPTLQDISKYISEGTTSDFTMQISR